MSNSEPPSTPASRQKPKKLVVLISQFKQNVDFYWNMLTKGWIIEVVRIVRKKGRKISKLVRCLHPNRLATEMPPQPQHEPKQPEREQRNPWEGLIPEEYFQREHYHRGLRNHFGLSHQAWEGLAAA